jgi:hypothetical protein
MFPAFESLYARFERNNVQAPMFGNGNDCIFACPIPATGDWPHRVDTGNCPGVGRLPKVAIRHRNVSADVAERFVETGSIWLWWMVSLNQCNGPSL